MWVPRNKRRELAAGIGSGVTARFHGNAFGKDTSEAVLGLQRGGKITADCRVFGKTRDAAEPVRGAKGKRGPRGPGRTGSPRRPAGLHRRRPGMPQESIDLGRIYTAQWTRRDGGLYALLPDADDTFRNAPITGDRVQIRLSELHLADEARLAARQLAGAST